MPELTEFNLHTHSLSNAQRALVQRTISHFHSAQGLIRIIESGEHPLPVIRGRVSWEKLNRAFQPTSPQIIVTGFSLDDNWFSHTDRNRSIITVAEWDVAFADDVSQPPAAAPDAYLLVQFIEAVLIASTCADEEAFAHNNTTGCLWDMCEYKPDLALKLRSGYLCPQCRNLASQAGLSGVYLDAIQSLLDQMRLLALGRAPQPELPTRSSAAQSATFIADAAFPSGFSVPTVLLDALRSKSVTILVGSGLSLQNDVKVHYQACPDWRTLPSWSEISARLSQRLLFFRGQSVQPRKAETLREHLVDLDFFRESLGPRVYYPRAIFDLFLPQIESIGTANKLVFELPHRWIITTNYDFVLDYAAPQGTPKYTWKEARQAGEYLQRAGGVPPLLKLHGCASRADTIVLTSHEYDALHRDDEYRSLIALVFSQQAILFLGYGLNDPLDLDMALSSANLAGAAQGEKFALVQRTCATGLRDKFPNVNMLLYDSHNDIPQILATLVRETSG